MIWIGHNNLDWTEGLSAAQREHPEKRLQEMAAQFRENYREPVQSLIDRAKTENHNVSIVVFGLANIEAFLKAGERQLKFLGLVQKSSPASGLTAQRTR